MSVLNRLSWLYRRALVLPDFAHTKVLLQSTSLLWDIHHNNQEIPGFHGHCRFLQHLCPNFPLKKTCKSAFSSQQFFNIIVVSTDEISPREKKGISQYRILIFIQDFWFKFSRQCLENPRMHFEIWSLAAIMYSIFFSLFRFTPV